MLGEDIINVLNAAVRALHERAREDAAFRESLSRIGRTLLDIAEGAAGEGGASDAATQAGPSSEVRLDESAAAKTEPTPVSAATLRIGDESTTVLVPEGSGPERLTEPARPTITGPTIVAQPPRSGRTTDLGVIARRCKLKAEATRWAITRRRRLDEGADFQTAIAPADRELVDRARSLPDCYLWMLDPYGVMPPDDHTLNIIDASYTNLADAASLVLEVRRRQEEHNGTGGGSAGTMVEEAVRLLTEAQSALRVILSELLSKPDQDQFDIFAWLKDFTFEERIYLDRFMRLSDPADPQNWSDLHDRIERLRDEMDESGAKSARRSKLLNRARYHLRKLDEGELDDWRKVMMSVDELVADGVPPSDLELRELLLPILDEIPEEITLGPGASQAVREVDRYLASREAARDAAPSPPREPTEDVQRVAELLEGKTIVLIGGDERAEAARAMERAFELEKLRWVSARPHQSLSTFEPEVARDDAALVILAIRFSSHSFEGVKAMCDRFGKPFVRLPGGYGVNQVARQILQQVGNRLAEDVRSGSAAV